MAPVMCVLIEIDAIACAKHYAAIALGVNQEIVEARNCGKAATIKARFDFAQSRLTVAPLVGRKFGGCGDGKAVIRSM